MEIRHIGIKLLFILLFSILGLNFIIKSIYPRIVYTFENVDSNFYWGAANEACDKATELTPEINVMFRQRGNNFKSDFFPIFLTKKNYSTLYINKISYIYEEKEFMALCDAFFNLCPDIKRIDELKKGWITNGTYYWMNGWEAERKRKTDKNTDWPSTNFRRIFKNKKIGDEFPFSIIIIYRFDNEKERQLEIKYKVKAVKNRYVSPFMGL